MQPRHGYIYTPEEYTKGMGMPRPHWHLSAGIGNKGCEDEILKKIQRREMPGHSSALGISQRWIFYASTANRQLVIFTVAIAAIFRTSKCFFSFITVTICF